MIPIVQQRKYDLIELCRRRQVLRLELFGSAVTGGFVPGISDLDFLVEFQPISDGAYVDAFFGLLEELEGLFRMRVDLVVDSAIKNPFFRQAVDETKALIYAA